MYGSFEYCQALLLPLTVFFGISFSLTLKSMTIFKTNKFSCLPTKYVLVYERGSSGVELWQTYEFLSSYQSVIFRKFHINYKREKRFLSPSVVMREI